MPTFGNVVLNDGATTPVAHTFEPVEIDAQSIAHYNDIAVGVPIGFGRLSVSLKRAKADLSPGSNSRNAVNRVRMKFEIPTLEATSPSTASGIQPAPTVAYTTMAVMEFVIPNRSTEANRKDILAYAKNLLGHALATDLVVGQKSVY